MPIYLIQAIVLLIIVSIYWIFMCLSFFKKRILKNYLFDIKKTNKKFMFAMSFIYFLIPFYTLFLKLYRFIRSIIIYNKLCAIEHKVGQETINIQLDTVQKEFKSIILLTVIILLYLIAYYIHNFSAYKIYENGIFSPIFTITWDEIIDCTIKENYIYLKCNYKLFNFSKIIIHTIKLEDNTKLISILKKHNVNLIE